MGVDPYVDPATGVLRNRLGITDGDKLAEVEGTYTRQRLAALGKKPTAGGFDLSHLQAIHRYVAQDVYDWAGKIRTVDISKGSEFSLVQHIVPYADQVFRDLAARDRLAGLGRDDFVTGLAHFYSDMNALHPFREVNGRTQRAFMSQVADRVGWYVAWERMDSERNVAASIASFNGDEEPLRTMLRELIEPRAATGGTGSPPPGSHGPAAPGNPIYSLLTGVRSIYPRHTRVGGPER